VQWAGELGGDWDVGGAAAHQLFANVGYYRGEQTVVKLLDLQAYTGRVGGLYHTLWADIVPSLGFEHVLLSQSTYLRDYSQDVRATHHLSRRSSVWLDVSREDQNFINTPRVPLGADRRGKQYEGSFGGQTALTPLDRVTASVGHRRKLALNVSDSYRREYFNLDYTRLLGHGMYAATGAEFDFDRYDEADPTIVSTVRHDNIVVGRVMFGAPLSLLWKPLDGFTGTLSYERYQAGSNVASYQYTNDKFTALITYLWGI
jgi:hypothetical protein